MSKQNEVGQDDYPYRKSMTVGIRDINYGGHVGNDVYLSYCQEGRLGYLKQLGFSEMDIGGCGIILIKSELEYRSELFHGDRIEVMCRVPELKNTSFVMEYAVIKEDGSNALNAKTVLVAFDYVNRKVTRVPEVFRQKVLGFEEK
ncbi:MAG: acyl-CoA thioesterase [Spirochaetaceae bacterium]|nr:MAG: acyl-CoA thioesterase [Spirochaetaceae bacterium]